MTDEPTTGALKRALEDLIEAVSSDFTPTESRGKATMLAMQRATAILSPTLTAEQKKVAELCEVLHPLTHGLWQRHRCSTASRAVEMFRRWNQNGPEQEEPK